MAQFRLVRCLSSLAINLISVNSVRMHASAPKVQRNLYGSQGQVMPTFTIESILSHSENLPDFTNLTSISYRWTR